MLIQARIIDTMERLMIDLETRILQLRYKHACIAMQLALKRIALAYGFKYSPDQPRDDHGRWTSGGGAGGSLSSLGQNLLGDLASSVLPGVISGLAGTLGDIGGAMDPSTLLGSGLDSSTLGNGLDTTALGNGLSNGIDLTPTGSVIGTTPDGTPIDNAVLAQGDRAGFDLAAQD